MDLRFPFEHVKAGGPDLLLPSGWLKNGCAVLPAPDREWLNSASVCQAAGRLGAADGAGHTVRLCWSTDLSPRGV
jgi:hypothetical protein